MRERILIAAAVVSSVWLGACSKPNPSEVEEAAAGAGSRQIELASPTPAERAVVSDLEAGRKPERVLVESKRGALKVKPAPAALTTVDEAIQPREAHVHSTSVTTTPTPEPVLRLATAPSAPVFGVARAPDGTALQPMTDNGWRPDIANRGPAIIIRGGMGRIDDDCDEHNIMGRRGGGAAVNRLAPPTAGGGRISLRGGIR